MHQFAVFTGNSRYDVVVDRVTMRPLMLKQAWGTDTGIAQGQWHLLAESTPLKEGERIVCRFAGSVQGGLTTSPVRDFLPAVPDGDLDFLS